MLTGSTLYASKLRIRQPQLAFSRFPFSCLADDEPGETVLQTGY
jgi:hypothetical protein